MTREELEVIKCAYSTLDKLFLSSEDNSLEEDVFTTALCALETVVKLYVIMEEATDND